MARLTLSYQNLYDRVSHFLGLTAEGTTPTGNNLTKCKDIVARGLRQFLYPIDERDMTPYEWSFLDQYWSFSTVANQWKYVLPLDFSELKSGFSFDDNKALPSLTKRSGEQIEQLRNISNSSGTPQYYALVSTRYDLELGTTYELWLYPTPSQAYLLSTFYRIDPLKMSGTTDLAPGGISAVEALLETCLAVAEIQEEDSTSTIHQQEARRLIQTLIRFDTGKTSTSVIGNLYQSAISREPDVSTLFASDINFERDIYA